MLREEVQKGFSNSLHRTPQVGAGSVVLALKVISGSFNLVTTAAKANHQFVLAISFGTHSPPLSLRLHRTLLDGAEMPHESHPCLHMISMDSDLGRVSSQHFLDSPFTTQGRDRFAGGDLYTKYATQRVGNG